MAIVFVAMARVWLVAYSLAAGAASAVLRRSGVRRALAALTGSVLIGFGLRLASDLR